MSPDGRENKGRESLNVFVNGCNYHLVKGMSVRHALLAAGLLCNDQEIPTVLDEWGNMTGLDGTLTEGIKLFTSK